MGIFNFFKKPIDSKEMIQLAQSWTNSFIEFQENELKLSKPEVFMFYSWKVWDYFNNYYKLSNAKQISEIFFQAVYKIAFPNNEISFENFTIDYNYFRVELYKIKIERFFNSDFHNNYTLLELFNLFHKDEFNLNSLKMSELSSNFLEADKMHLLTEFTENFKLDWDLTTKELLTKYK